MNGRYLLVMSILLLYALQGFRLFHYVLEQVVFYLWQDFYTSHGGFQVYQEHILNW